MNKYISLTLAILNTVMFGLYFTQLTQVDLKIYITERNKMK
jgi:hypothetical protein